MPVPTLNPVTKVTTSSGVRSTARAAYDAGFHVTVASDAAADRDEAAHRHRLEQVFPRMAETGTTDEIIAHLSRSQPVAVPGA